MKKSKAKVTQDYARNAEADGNTKAGKYEEKMAVESAAKMINLSSPMKMGSKSPAKMGSDMSFMNKHRY